MPISRRWAWAPATCPTAASSRGSAATDGIDHLAQAGRRVPRRRGARRDAGEQRPAALRRRADAERRDARLRRAARRRRRHASASPPARNTPILGSNGAGKTTLFNAITGDFPPTAGRIHFFGEDMTTLPPHERIRKGLRRTYQSSLLFRDLTVRDNLFLAVRGIANGRFSFRRAGESHASTVATQRSPRAGAAQPHRRRARRQSRPRPAAPARDRDGPGRRAASHPVRRAGCRPLARRTARARRSAAPRCRRT